MKTTLADLYAMFGLDEELVGIVESAYTGNFTDQMMGQLLETTAAAQTGGVDSVFYAQTMDTIFNTFELMFSDTYTTITETGENSYDLQMTMDSAGFNELMAASLDGQVAPEDLPQMEFDLQLNETVENGVGTSSTFEMTLTINNSENEDFSMTFSGSSSLDTEATVEDIELPSTALDLDNLLGALGIILGGTVSGS